MQWITPFNFALSWEKFIWSMGEPCETSTSISSGVKCTPERISASDNSGYKYKYYYNHFSRKSLAIYDWQAKNRFRIRWN